MSGVCSAGRRHQRGPRSLRRKPEVFASPPELGVASFCKSSSMEEFPYKCQEVEPSAKRHMNLQLRLHFWSTLFVGGSDRSGRPSFCQGSGPRGLTARARAATEMKAWDESSLDVVLAWCLKNQNSTAKMGATWRQRQTSPSCPAVVLWRVREPPRTRGCEEAAPFQGTG